MNSSILIFVICSIIGVHGFPESRVVGGHDAPDGAHPYTVSIRYKGEHFCGGSIVNARYILSAAHCFYQIQASDVTVLAGSNSRTGNGQICEVEELIVHESYLPYLNSFDIALIRLKTPLVFNEKVKPVKLASVLEGEEDTFPVVLTGWGRLSASGTKPNKLQEITLRILDHITCKARNYGVNNKMICTLTKEGEGACMGDSGGPLVNLNGEQVGIVSFGRPCAIGEPDVYTRVSYFYTWIQENLH